jgi:hypothetical protein
MALLVRLDECTSKGKPVQKLMTKFSVTSGQDAEYQSDVTRTARGVHIEPYKGQTTVHKVCLVRLALGFLKA